MNISFCTTSKNRLHQLKETIFENLEEIKKDGRSELILVNYNDDELESFAHKKLKSYIEDGVLIYLRESSENFFDLCKAKNIAHLASNKEFLFNLDGDNFIRVEEMNYFRLVWEKQKNCIIHNYDKGEYDKSLSSGSYGRIGIRSSEFIKVGGYDEEFEFIICEDRDLIQRLLANQCTYTLGGHRIKRPIQNTQTECIQNTEAFYKNKKINIIRLCNENYTKTQARIKTLGPVRNRARKKVKLIKNFTDIVYI